MHRPHLLFLSTESPFGPGGIGRHAWELSRALARLDWSVRMLAPPPTGQSNSPIRCADSPVEVRSLDRRGPNPMWILRRSLQVIKSAFDPEPDAVLTSGMRATWVGAVVSVFTAKPLVVVGHGSEYKGGTLAQTLLNRWALRRAASVVAVSRYTAALVRSSAKHARRLVVIPNGVDAEKFRPLGSIEEIRERLCLRGRTVLLTVGRICERKAQDVVVRALPAILEVFPTTIYVLVGLPERAEELMATARRLGVASAIRIVGVVPEDHLVDYYNACDLFVLVSRGTLSGDVEGFGMALLEAAACGKTGVVSTGCGLSDAADEGRAALLVPPDSPDETARAVKALLGDFERRQALERQAFAWAQAHTWQAVAAEYNRVLRQAIGW